MGPLVGSSGMAAPAPVSGPSTRPELLSLEDRLQAWTRRTPGSAARLYARRSISRLDALSALAGGPRRNVRCGSDILLALQQNVSRLNQPTRKLFDRVIDSNRSSTTRSFASPGGRFRLLFATDPASPDRVNPYDGNLDRIPDGIERLAVEFTDVLADFVHRLDWSPAPSPVDARYDVVDVYLVGLGGSAGASGYTVPVMGARTEGANAQIFLDTRFAETGPDAPESRGAVVHQIAHLVQLRESASESPWWHEASALWLEDRLEGTAGLIAREFTSRHSRRARGLQDGSLGLSLEGFLWPHYLSRSTGDDPVLIRQLWEEMAAVPGNNTLEAMNRVLSQRFGTGLADEVAVFNVWNLFLGQADDGLHYSFGGALPTPQGDATYDLFPVSGGPMSGPLAPSGSALVRLLGDGSSGGLKIDFKGDVDVAWDVALIVYSAVRPGEAHYVPVPIEQDGRGEVVFPWRKLAGVDVLIQNLSEHGSPESNYSFSIDYDPLVPFDLLAFTVADSRRGATLSWTTDSEQRLAGWNVYRSLTPFGPFTRVNHYLFPAGGTEEPMSYVFVDADIERGRKYYYQVEGVTHEGFTEVSHPAGVRLRGHRRR